MPGYTAQKQSLYGNVGVSKPQGPQVDVAGAIDALSNAAQSHIHQAMLRRLAEQSRQDRLAHEQQEAQRYAEEREIRRQQFEATHALAVRKEEREALMNGITPGTEGGATVAIAPEPEAPLGANMPTSSIAQAMTASMARTPAPKGALDTPITEGSLGTVPKVTVGREAPTPATIDPEKAVSVVRSTEAAKIRAQNQLETTAMRNASRERIGEQMSARAIKAAQIRAGAQVEAAGKRAAGGGSNIGRAISGTALEQRFEKVDAPGLLAEAGWDLDAANEALKNTEGGKALAAQGFTPRHLAAAWTKHQESLVTTAGKLQTGAMGATPAEAATAVKDTRKLMGADRPVPPKGASAAPPAGAPPGGRVLGTSGTPDFDAAAAKYQALLKAGVPKAEALAAYNQTVERIVKKLNLPTTGTKK